MKHRVSSRTNKGFRMESTDLMKKQAELNYGKLGQLDFMKKTHGNLAVNAFT